MRWGGSRVDGGTKRRTGRQKVVVLVGVGGVPAAARLPKIWSPPLPGAFQNARREHITTLIFSHHTDTSTRFFSPSKAERTTLSERHSSLTTSAKKKHPVRYSSGARPAARLWMRQLGEPRVLASRARSTRLDGSRGFAKPPERSRRSGGGDAPASGTTRSTPHPLPLTLPRNAIIYIPIQKPKQTNHNDASQHNTSNSRPPAPADDDHPREHANEH